MSSCRFYLSAMLVLALFADLKTALAFVTPIRTEITVTTTTTPTGIGATRHEGDINNNINNNDGRRGFLVSVLSTATVAASTVMPPAAAAAEPKKRYVLDEETGDYVEVLEEGDWKKEWKSRYEQMSTMSRDEIFVAARGAGNVDSKDLENESPASKKRRAFSGCRDKATRSKLGNIDEKSCSKRVLEGDIEFVLNVL